MLNKVRVVTDGDYRDINTTMMKEYVRQRSNSRWLSTAKVPLGVYLLAGRDSNWVNKVIKMIGEAPVVYDSTLAKLSCEDLKQALVNKGYLDAEVELYLDIKKSKVNAIYADFFGDSKPARSCVEVARLPKDGLVEIEFTAVRPSAE